MKKKFIIRALAVFVMLVSFRAATSSIATLINNLLAEMGYSFEDQAIISGTVLTLGYVASIVGSMFGGRIADKVGAVRTMISFGAVFAAAFMLMAYTTAGVLFYINRVVLALCTGALYIALQSYLLGGVIKGREGMAMGIYGLAFGVGTALSGVASGYADKIGISQVYIGLGIMCIIAVVLGYIATVIDRKTPYPEGVAPAIKEAQEAIPLKKLFAGSRKSIYILLLNSFLYGIGILIFLQYIDELGDARGLPGTSAAYGIAVFSIISLLQPVAGMIADRIGKVSCIVIGQVLIAIGWSGVALIPELNLGIVLLLSGIAGVGAALFSPSALAIAELSAVPGSGGTIRGVYQGFTSGGSALAALLGSVIYMKSGIGNVFVVLLVACIVGFLLSLVLARMVKKERSARGA